MKTAVDSKKTFFLVKIVPFFLVKNLRSFLIFFLDDNEKKKLNKNAVKYAAVNE